MPFCPECQAEYREGFTRCATCDVDLVDRLPEAFDLSEENISKALDGQDLVPVVRQGDFDVVKEMRAFLASKQLASLILDDKDSKPPPGAPARVMLVVGNADEEAARQFLGEKFKDMVADEGLASDGDLNYGTCPACGQPVEDDQVECPECGLFIGKA